MTRVAAHTAIASPRLIRSILAWLALACVLVLVGRALATQLAQLHWSTLHLRWLPLLGCAVLLIAVQALRVPWLRLLLEAHGALVTWREATIVAWLPPIAKFVPGQIFTVLGAVALLRTFAVPRSVGLAAVLIMDGIAVLTGLIVGAPLLWRAPLRQAWPQGWIAAALIIAAVAVALHPAVFRAVLNALRTPFQRHRVRTRPSLRAYALPVLIGCLQWILVGTALWLMARSVTDVSLAQLPVCIPIAALAYTAGYLTPFAPGGLGIREAIVQALLLPILGAPVAVVVIALRVLQILIEVGLAAAGGALLRHTAAGARA